MNNWYSTVTNKGSAYEQGLIIEESTGDPIAVSYKSENAKLIAAAPELLEFTKSIIRYLEAGGITTKSDKKFVSDMAWELYYKVTEG